MLSDNLPLNEKQVLHGPCGEIVESAIKEAEEIVSSFCPHPTDGATFRFPSPQRLWESGNDWNTWMIPKGKYSGTWPKRYQSYVYQQFGCRPPESMVAKLGEILSRFANCEQTYVVDFVNECDWDPGDFGENRGSCWWNEYSNARTGLFDNGGMAMRFYTETGKGCGRCWIYPEDDRLYIFNAYHKNDLSLYNMACLLSTFLGVSYKRCDIDAPRAYVNNDTGYCIAPVGVLMGINPDRSVTLEFADEPEDERECYHCGRHFPEDDNWYRYDDNDICERCMDNHYFNCYGCNETFYSEDCNDAEDNQYCNDCFSELFTSCCECGDAVANDDIIEVDCDYYCEDCAPKECEECGERDKNLQDGLCPGCVPDKEEAK